MAAADKVLRMFESNPTPKGNAGYDNPRQNIDTHLVAPTITTNSLRIGTGAAVWSSDGTNVYLKNGSTTILTINLTTGNITLGGTQKYITCSQIIGA